MATRRMINNAVIDTDLFMEMPLSSQALYFHFSMKADDDGMIGNRNLIMRMVGAKEDDYKVLLAKGFVMEFQTKVIAITHWRLNNTIRKDRMTPSVYQDELLLLRRDKNGIYHPEIDTFIEKGIVKKIDCQPTVNQPSTNCQHSIVEYSIVDYSIDKYSIDTISPKLETKKPTKSKLSHATAVQVDSKPFITLTLNTKEEYPISNEQVKEFQGLYQAINVEQELKKMKGWLIANPKNRKTKSGIMRFVNSWLARTQDKAKVVKPKNTITNINNAVFTDNDYE